MDTRKLTVAAVSLVVVGVVYASSAGATPASTGDDAPTPVQGVVVPGSGVFGGILDDSGRGDLEIEQDDVEVEVDDHATVQMFDLRYPPGSFSGWHSHAGIVLAVVKQGTVVRQAACKSETFTVGQSFYEVGPHHVSNPSDSTVAVLAVTRIFPTELGAARIDEPAPRCRG